MRNTEREMSQSAKGAVLAIVASVLIASASVPVVVAAPSVPQGGPDKAGTNVDAKLRPGTILPLRLSAANRATRLEIVNASLEDRYGSLTAQPGQALLVLTARW